MYTTPKTEKTAIFNTSIQSTHAEYLKYGESAWFDPNTYRNSMNKTILTDVDGVLLIWEEAFTRWMTLKNYTVQVRSVYSQATRYNISEDKASSLVEEFNKSAWIGFLKPIPDAVEYVNKLGEEGYTFECLTSLTTDKHASDIRMMNVQSIFGPYIKSCKCIATGADKDEALTEWAPGHWWIEDKPINAIAGLNAGHKPILITQDYNRDFHISSDDIVRANGWKEIYEIITHG